MEFLNLDEVPAVSLVGDGGGGSCVTTRCKNK